MQPNPPRRARSGTGTQRTLKQVWPLSNVTPHVPPKAVAQILAARAIDTPSAAAATETSRGTHWAEIKHPGWTEMSGDRSPWQHAQAGTERRAALGYSLHRGDPCGQAHCCGAPSAAGLYRVWDTQASLKVEQPSNPLVPARLPPPLEHWRGNALSLAAPSLRIKREAIG